VNPNYETLDLLSEIHFVCIVFAVYQTGEMMWFDVNLVVNGTISLVLISKLEIKYLVYGSVNVMINLEPELSQN